MFGARERYLRKIQTLSSFIASLLMREHATSFVVMSFVGVFGVLLFFVTSVPYFSQLMMSRYRQLICSVNFLCPNSNCGQKSLGVVASASK